MLSTSPKRLAVKMFPLCPPDVQIRRLWVRCQVSIAAGLAPRATPELRTGQHHGVSRAKGLLAGWKGDSDVKISTSLPYLMMDRTKCGHQVLKSQQARVIEGDDEALMLINLEDYPG